MDNKIKTTLCCAALLAGALTACTSEPSQPPVGDGEHVCHLTFNISKAGYDDSRADDDGWKNGDCVYLSFDYGDSQIDGRAVYDAAAEYWTLYYNGQITNGATGICRAYYFDGDCNDAGEGVRLSELTCVYADIQGHYTKTIDGMAATAALTPLTGRIRFIGEAGMEFNIINVSHHYSFRKAQAEILYNDDPLSVTVGDEGSSQYLYIGLPTEKRTLTITYDNLTFLTDCEHPVLDPGLSGYMTVPTKLNHNGWRMIEKTVPTLGDVSVADIEMHSASLTAKLISDGNSPVSETGFCYSTTENPTISDYKVECQLSGTSFGYTLTGLPVKTTYHVRAYAVNEMGITYSTEVIFTTKGSKPEDDDNNPPHV